MEVLIENRDFEGLKELIKKERKNLPDEELIILKVDQLVRKRGLNVTKQPIATVEEFARRHFNFVVQLMRANLCSKVLPITTLQDFLETSSIEQCRHLFGIIEEHMVDFKQPPLNEVGQNSILRFCNDLLRRLSRTAETSFCGRIMFFLSRYLPLAEKSGLNLMGHFNTQNITSYEEVETESESLLATTSTPLKESEDMEIGEITSDDSKEIQVTPEMYRQFWSIQKFLANPAQLYEKEKFVVFKKDLANVLSFLTTNKLDKSSAEDEEMERNSKREKLASDDLFFSKYLTSPKLLSLQLNDSQLRRYFLLQCLIIFQYLTSDVRFKVGVKKMILNEEQTKFVTDSEDKCYRLLSETLPKGSNFSAVCKRILQRELEWSNWKNINCPDISEKADKAAMQMYKKRARVEFNPDAIDLGSAEMTKLWTYEPNVLEFCKSSKRRFEPSLVEFLRDPLDEMDPEQQVEEQYKSVNNSAFQWRAARLLLIKAPQYVSKLEKSSSSCDPANSMREYLEKTFYSTAKTLDEFKDEIEAREKREAAKKEELKKSADNSLTDENLEILAEALIKFSKQLAEVFGSDEILKTGNEKEYNLKLLKDWTSKNGRNGKTLLNTLISDVEIVEIATRTLKNVL
ncbi:unnamed protein product [Caenorhabditis angaria]|uniref:THO complex subunit 1 n=1 Tax=Caenorhabditis angaria TaxID=860376 RepID=A0A9P1IDU6_9PELO|nr:unnamed protein product [Caenorhabditis angaria]